MSGSISTEEKVALMAHNAETINIACTPDQAWDALADFGAIAKWAPNVDHSCLTTSKGAGTGTVRRVQVGRNALLERVVEWEPGERLTYAIEGLPPVVSAAVNSWSVEASGDATTVTLKTQIDTGPQPPRKVVGGVLAKVMGKASVQMLHGLKSHLEGVSR